MLNPQFFIGFAIIAGLLTFIIMAMFKLSSLAGQYPDVREVFLKLMSPASLISIMILLGVLFLLGMAILDLDKGRVLVGMGKTEFARGLITYLFAVVTIGTAVVLVLSALLGTDKEKFESAKDILGLLLGIFGTIIGFYFGAEVNKQGQTNLMISSVMTNSQETSLDKPITITAFVRGGAPPYRFAVAVDQEPLPTNFPELVRVDGWITKQYTFPANSAPGVKTLTIGAVDSSGDKVTAQTYVSVGSQAKSQ